MGIVFWIFCFAHRSLELRPSPRPTPYEQLQSMNSYEQFMQKKVKVCY